jgi:uncharacterized protein (UPF0305 family)
MEQLQQRVSRLEQDVANPKRAEAESSFISRDLVYKSDLAQAMLKVLHEDVRHIKSSLIDAKEDIEYLKLKADDMDKRLDQHGEMLRQILGLLTPQYRE